MSRFMLDTNSVTYALRGNKQMLLQLSWHPVESMFLSCVSEGEIIYGLGLLPGSHKLHSAVAELLQRLHILPWNSATAQTYVRCGLICIWQANASRRWI